jgi:hypothetical protein
MFNFVHNYKATSYFSDDELGKKKGCYININEVITITALISALYFVTEHTDNGKQSVS